MIAPKIRTQERATQLTRTCYDRIAGIYDRLERPWRRAVSSNGALCSGNECKGHACLRSVSARERTCHPTTKAGR